MSIDKFVLRLVGIGDSTVLEIILDRWVSPNQVTKHDQSTYSVVDCDQETIDSIAGDVQQFLRSLGSPHVVHGITIEPDKNLPRAIIFIAASTVVVHDIPRFIATECEKLKRQQVFCAMCGKSFNTPNWNKAYCSPTCRKRAELKRRKKKNVE